ncbi:hypothetical protein PCANC_19867 [Puccinia coronata f. sp. avenae]|uniref:Uncharacterized protein n=1 Tax=Puccinia coronata f. sp. avenae TaxID=200324 RepID=A0A2N5UEZ4_9BASI|nr:hypothetical protein PCANC_19867 [Puccinia coronata f. sp. avenae]
MPGSQRTNYGFAVLLTTCGSKGVRIGYQLGLHNWRILREDMSVESSHDVTFEETLYPGISSHDPAGLIAPPEAFLEYFSDDEEVDLLPHPVQLMEDKSGDSEGEVERQLCRPSTSNNQLPESSP